MPKTTIKKIQEAYSRFKSYVYYDNFNLALRAKLAEYESENLGSKLTKLKRELSDYLETGTLSARLERKINKCSFILLPKSFKQGTISPLRGGVLFSNQFEQDYTVTDTTALFDGDIELHLIATLWIMEEGVKLHEAIGQDNYGYNMPVKHKENKLATQRLLFTKYFEKYQKWRDNGISAARSQIDSGNDVLLISLDIKRFFPSTRIDFEALKRDVGCDQSFSLSDLVEKICVAHTKKVRGKMHDNKPQLPIGLVSSGVIANWLLIDFDRKLKDKLAPVYYGRYVDDIFIVVSNLKPPPELNESKSNSDNSTEGSEQTTKKTIEWLHKRFFHDNEPLTINYEGKDGPAFEFSDEKHKGLQIQANKLKLFYFSPEWPLAMLNKFQKTLEENSSAFWFLPEDEEMSKSLDEKAYDLYYEDTINKFRSISDLKASKYGASVFLAKKIKLAVLHSEVPDVIITKELFRFFKGVSLLAHYGMWEKVFTYFVVTKDKKSIKEFRRKILVAINALRHEISNQEDSSQDLQDALNKHLDCCLALAFSLNPGLADDTFRNTPNQREIINDIQEGVVKLRHALLSRHHYLPLPSLALTSYYTDGKGSLLAQTLYENLLEKKTPLKINTSIENNIWRLPRWIYLQEISMLQLLLATQRNTANRSACAFYTLTYDTKKKKHFFNDNYIKNCKDLYEKLNEKSLGELIDFDRLKTFRQNQLRYPKIQSYRLSIKDDNEDENPLKLTIGLTNMHLREKDLKDAISTKSDTSTEKRKKHIKLLNMAEKEKVDMLILPETAVPFQWLYAYSDEARRKNRAFIMGLEHFTFNNYCLNLSVAILPFRVGKMKDALIVPRLKNHYSPTEERKIKEIGKDLPRKTTSFYHLFQWQGIQFTIYNCYELADVTHRSIFRSELDILFAIEYNRDVNYFSNIAEASCRDLHCYFVQANTSNYGDTRVVEPKKSEEMNPVRVKGGENNVILKYTLDVKKLRDFQRIRQPYQACDKSFKPTPPDYDHDWVKKRGRFKVNK